MTSSIDLSPDQRGALQSLLNWYTRDSSSYITLGGYAGTGKTTLVGVLRMLLHKHNPDLKVAFCSYTGKGTLVLKNKLEALNVNYKGDTISTIHSLIYEPIENQNQEIVGWKKKEALKTNLIIVDEASMVDQTIWADLLSYKVRIIAVGDHGQLPPIGENFNLMESPTLKLTKIHRQMKGNPIITLSSMAREKGHIPSGSYGVNIKKYSREDTDFAEVIESLLLNYDDTMLILCGYNQTRVHINNQIRYHLGFETQEPISGDKVICLRNNHTKGIYNGLIGTIKTIEEATEDFYYAEIDMENGKKYKGAIYKHQFNSKEPINFTKDRKKIGDSDIFDFGYALTVHKAQGSEADKVILFEERFSKMDDETWKRWLYTAITRAKKQLFIFGSD